jgi:hypothetical protein
MKEGKTFSFKCELDRAPLQDLLNRTFIPNLLRLADTLIRSVEENKIDIEWENIELFFAGGTSKIPIIQEKVRDWLHNNIIKRFPNSEYRPQVNLC